MDDGVGPPKFKVGDPVRVVKMFIASDEILLNKWGTVREVDDIHFGDTRLQVNYDVDGHYLHEEMLEPYDQSQNNASALRNNDEHKDKTP